MKTVKVSIRYNIHPGNPAGTHSYDQEYIETADHCPKCHTKLWSDAGEGDYYVGPEFYCPHTRPIRPGVIPTTKPSAPFDMNFYKSPPAEQFVGLFLHNGYVIKVTHRRKRRKAPTFTAPCSQPPGSMAVNAFGAMSLKNEIQSE